MANISEFTHPVVAPTPTDIAATTAREAGTVENRLTREAGTALGGAISRVGGQVGATVDRHMAAQAISHGSSTYSSLFADLSSQWDKLASNADPNDTSIAQGFKEKILDPSIEKFQQAFDSAPAAAQEWALTRANELRQHFGKTISADMSTRAGLAVHQNLDSMERNYSITAANNPASLDFIADSVRKNVDALIGQHDITAKDAAVVRNELVPKMTQRVAHSALEGIAQNDAAAAIKALDRGDFNKYADAVTQTQWRREAEREQRIQDHDKKQDELAAKQEKIEASATLREDYRSKMYNHLTGEVLPVQPRLNQKIWNDVRDGKLTSKDATELINFNYVQYQRQLTEQKQASAGPPAKDDAQVLADLRDRVGSITNPTTMQDIVDATAADKLTSKSSHDLAWRVSQADKAWAFAVGRPFKAEWDRFAHVALHSQTSILSYAPATQQIERLNQIEADAQHTLREAYARREDMRPYFDPKSPKYILREATSSLSGPASPVLQQQADEIRRQEKINQIPGAELPRIKGDDDYNALKSGTRFIGPDGKERTKP